MAQDVSAQIRLSLSRQCAPLGIPVSGIFELTPRCNLRCKMCYVRLTPQQMASIGQELTAEQWINLAHQAKNEGMIFLLLTGGEPMLRGDFCQIYEALSHMGFSISVNTNGTMLSPEIRDLWSRYPPAMVNVTVYGTSAEDYRKLCGDGSAFEKLTDALRWLKKQNILVHLNTTIATDNANQWMKLERFAENMALELRMTTYCFPPVRREQYNCEKEFSRLSPEAAADLICKDMLHQNGLDYIKNVAGSLSTLPPMECEGIGETIQCMAGRAQFWVTWNGQMTPCGMLPFPVVTPLSTDFKKAWCRLHEQVSAIRLCPECVNCAEKDTCMNCAAVTYTETGRFDGVPEYMCSLNRTYRKIVKELSET